MVLGPEEYPEDFPEDLKTGNDEQDLELIILDQDLDCIERMPDLAEDFILPRTKERLFDLRMRYRELKEKGINPFGENL